MSTEVSCKDSPCRVVLDTHVALDGLLFRQPTVAPLMRVLRAGDIAWIGTAVMRQEFEHILRHPKLARYSPECERILAEYDAHVCPLPEPASDPTLRCRDRDDQVFLDLALQHRAPWLLTRDRDLLSLTRRAARRGLGIVAPERFLGAAGLGGAGLDAGPDECSFRRAGL